MKVPSAQLDMIIKLFICIAAAAATIFAYIEQQNELTKLRIAIPSLSKELSQLNEENVRLQYEIDQFESPIHLMELARKPEFGHLKYPYKDAILVFESKDNGSIP